MKLFSKYTNQLTGYLFIAPAVFLIALFGIFPVFFGFYMSFHKWKVFKGRFLGFENYERILGDISSFWIFVSGLLNIMSFPIACIKWVFPRPTPPYINRGL